MSKLLDYPIDALVAAARRTLSDEIRRLRRASAAAKSTPEGMLPPEYQKNLIAACKAAGDLKKVDIAEQVAKKRRLKLLLPNMSDDQLDHMEQLLRQGVDPEEAAARVTGN